MKLSPEQCMRALFLFSWAITETLAQATPSDDSSAMETPTESALPSPSVPVTHKGSSQRDIRIGQAYVYGFLAAWLCSTLGYALYMTVRTARHTPAYDGGNTNSITPLLHETQSSSNPDSGMPVRMIHPNASLVRSHGGMARK